MDSPSAKALGKRKATSALSARSSHDSDLYAPEQAKPRTQPGKTPSTPNGVPPATQGRITRATRSSLGGSDGAGKGGTGGDGLSPQHFLPPNTIIRLVSNLPPNVKHFPFGANDPAAIAKPEPDLVGPAEPPAKSAEPGPMFRLLGPADTTSRSRHAGAAECDMSDAYYQRLHRFPEVLEKRSARLEVEKLISERNKLINELEELKGRGRVYAGVLGGKGEEERKRKIEEGEKKLLRYDYLLPNQPRKSSALNLTSASATPGARSASPLASTSRERQLTPLSAQGGASHTAIRIKFTQGRNGAITGGKQVDAIRKAGASQQKEEDEEDELEDDLWDESQAAAARRQQGRIAGGMRDWEGDLTAGGSLKRNRKAEKERRDERERLGLPPRVNLDKAFARSTNGSTPAEPARRRASSSVAYGSDVEMDELDDEVDQLEEENEVAEQLVIKKRKKRRAELMGTFFATKALRDSAMGAVGATRGSRRSSRVEYAFGQPTPLDLMVEQDFNLRSYYLDDTPSIESLVRARLGDDAPILLNGIWVPTSSFASLAHLPVKKYDPAQPQAAAHPTTTVTATISAASVSASTGAGSSPADASTPASTVASAASGAGGATVEIKEERIVPAAAGEIGWAAPEPEGTPLVPHEYVRLVPKRAKAVKRRRSSIAPRPAPLPAAPPPMSQSTSGLPRLKLSLSLSRSASHSPVPPAVEEEQRMKPRPNLVISVPPPAPVQPHEASSPLTPIAMTGENASPAGRPHKQGHKQGRKEERPVSPASSDVVIVEEVKPALGGGKVAGSPAPLPLPVFELVECRPAEAGEEEGLGGMFAAPPPRGRDMLLKVAKGKGV